MTERERLHQLYKEQFFDRYDLHEVCDKARAENGVLWPDFMDTAENDWHMGLFVGWMNGYQTAKADQSAELKRIREALQEIATATTGEGYCFDSLKEIAQEAMPKVRSGGDG